VQAALGLTLFDERSVIEGQDEEQIEFQPVYSRRGGQV
jgi:hypothetical protein